jgi:pilus assembly protein Flp/PilA
MPYQPFHARKAGQFFSSLGELRFCQDNPPMFRYLQSFLRDESGPTAVEYAVMLALIVAVCIASVHAMANATANSFNTSGQQLTGVLG